MRLAVNLTHTPVNRKYVIESVQTKSKFGGQWHEIAKGIDKGGEECQTNDCQTSGYSLSRNFFPEQNRLVQSGLAQKWSNDRELSE